MYVNIKSLIFFCKRAHYPLCSGIKNQEQESRKNNNQEQNNDKNYNQELQPRTTTKNYNQELQPRTITKNYSQ